MQARVTGGKAWPRIFPLLLIVAGVGVAFRQVARPRVDAWLLMVVFTVSEVDHSPMRSGIKGQLPFTEDESVNCTWLPGAALLWSAVPLSGVIAVVITHVSLGVLLPQATIAANTRTKSETQGPERMEEPLLGLSVAQVAFPAPVHLR